MVEKGRVTFMVQLKSKKCNYYKSVIDIKFHFFSWGEESKGPGAATLFERVIVLVIEK